LHSLPADWAALASVVLLLGFKHGFDADHLATIDGLTRWNAAAGRRFARYCGVLFSLGHGLVVIATALLAAAMTESWQVPAWLEASGTWISIFFLTALGALNLQTTVTATATGPVGLKSRFLGGVMRAGTPLRVALVGALFAISFDTVSQATLFALAAVQLGGAGHAVMLGILFTSGMLIMDGVNGLWVSQLLRRSDQLARIASRVMGFTLGAASLGIAIFSACKLMLPRVNAWSEGKEIAFGVIVTAAVFGGFVLGCYLARRPAADVATQ
jgi:nickel/cobalt transporter (NiCoT) family protein